MDKLKGMLGKALNKEGSSSSTGSKPTDPNAPDYGDKGLQAFEKKFGIAENRERDEKITDAARGQFEKMTGKKVPEKFSN